MPRRQILQIPRKQQWKLLLKTELIMPVKRMKSLKKEKPSKTTQEKMLPKNKTAEYNKKSAAPGADGGEYETGI